MSQVVRVIDVDLKVLFYKNKELLSPPSMTRGKLERFDPLLRLVLYKNLISSSKVYKIFFLENG